MEFVDYSEPLLLARKNLQQFELALLHGEIEKAKDYAEQTIVNIGWAVEVVERVNA